MQPRLADPRVGWFTMDQIDYGSDELKSDSKTFIRRWRLEPKDPIAYAKGELVEPIKPIVYYLDPATPKNCVSTSNKELKIGKAFETAGFKKCNYRQRCTNERTRS
jgi:hypothetical protein